jgi:hypothetical protein
VSEFLGPVPELVGEGEVVSAGHSLERHGAHGRFGGEISRTLPRTGPNAAVLHACSLLVPDVAARVFETLAAVLDTPPGSQTQLFAAAELPVMVGRSDRPHLEGPLCQQGDRCSRQATSADG